MARKGYESKDGARNELIDLISSVAAGDATREDAVADLKKRKVDALDVLIEVFAGQARAESPRRGSQIDVQSFTAKREPSSKPSQRVPRVPVLLRGTLYDPQDITRFDGTELHFIAAKDQMLAIDDRSVMENWWQASYLSSMASSDAMALKLTPDTTIVTVTDLNRTARTGGFGTGPGRSGPTDPGRRVVIPLSLLPPAPPYCEWVPAPAPVEHTNFYEHPRRAGDRLELRASEGEMSDLTDHHLGGIFSGDDWNDKISSIEMVRTEMTVLFEHVGPSGQSFSTSGNIEDLIGFAWDDRASAVRTWGSTPWLGVALACEPPVIPSPPFG